MSIATVLGIALGLAMDAFSVAVAVSGAMATVNRRQTFRLVYHFGLFQFMMPVIGWTLGYLVAEQIRSFDHWLAFGLLALIGGKMIGDSLSGDSESIPPDPTRGASLVMLSLATSIDALAVGLSLAFINAPVLYPSLVIGAVAATMTMLGLQLGKRAGHILGRRMETVGGSVLLFIGFKILFEHLAG